MKKITEKMLLDNYDGMTNGLDNISVIEGRRIIWTYRRIDGAFQPVTHDRSDADFIGLEYDRSGTVDLQVRTASHPAVSKILDNYNQVCGNMI